jgi:hypothetical protein
MSSYVELLGTYRASRRISWLASHLGHLLLIHHGLDRI